MEYVQDQTERPRRGGASTQSVGASTQLKQGPSLATLSALQASIDASPRMLAQRRTIQGAFGPAIQLQENPARGEQASTAREAPASMPANDGGLPQTLRAGMESLSGMDLSAIRVHRNSDRPAQLNALAYAQGDDIHLSPGQDQHLAHEAWHVVQQRQGRVRETMQLAGVSVNDDAGLENEAELMGGRALQQVATAAPRGQALPGRTISTGGREPVQRVLIPIAVAVATIGLSWAAKKLYDWLAADPTLGDIIKAEAAARGFSVRELELRVCEPGALLGGLYGSTRSGRDTYADLIGNTDSKLVSSCGQTSMLLGAAVFRGAVAAVDGEDALYGAINAAEDTYLRVQIGCHSFMVEKRGDTCRIYQSYIGYDALADNIDLDRPMSTSTFIANLRTVIHKLDADADAQEAGDVEGRMFHGEVDATRSLKPGETYRISCETAARTSDPDEIRAFLNTQLARYADAWDQIEASNETATALYTRYQ